MSKIIYLIEQPLDERNYDRFGIQTWIDRGWDAEVWDLTPLAHPRVWQNYRQSGRALKAFGGYFPVATKNLLICRYASFDDLAYFIDLTGDNYHSVLVKQHLIKKGAIRVICATGSIPRADDGKQCGMVCKIRKAATDGPIKLFKRSINALIRRLAAPSIKPGLIIISGEESIPRGPLDNNQELLKAQNLDYDIYLKLKGSVDTSVEEYAVFIDQDYCFHPDFIFHGIPFLTTPEKYFPAVCNGLRKISEALGVALSVAAHPRASYQQRGSDYFEGIPIEYGRTAELIKNCKVVVCHNSTAIQFAVLFEKPVIFLTTDELAASYAGESTAAFASELGKTVINLDRNLDDVNWRQELVIDVQKYAEYRNKYIKMDGSPEMPHWDIVIDHIEKSARRTTAGCRDNVSFCRSNSGIL